MKICLILFSKPTYESPINEYCVIVDNTVCESELEFMIMIKTRAFDDLSISISILSFDPDKNCWYTKVTADLLCSRITVTSRYNYDSNFHI